MKHSAGQRWHLLLIAGLVAALASPACAENATPERIEFLDAAQAFANGVANDRVTVMVFGAEWCGVCKGLERVVFADPQVREAAGAMSWAKIDIDEQPGLAAMYGVRAVPTILLLNTKGEPLHQHAGGITVREMTRLLEEYAGKANLPGAARGREEQLAALTDQANALPEGADVPTQTVVQILELLAKPDPIGVEQTRHRLAAMGPAVYNGLIETLGHDKLAVRAAAYDLLKQTTGEVIAFDPFLEKPQRDKQTQAWRDWLAEHRPEPALNQDTADATTPGENEAADPDKPAKPPRAPR